MLVIYQPLDSITPRPGLQTNRLPKYAKVYLDANQWQTLFVHGYGDGLVVTVILFSLSGEHDS